MIISFFEKIVRTGKPANLMGERVNFRFSSRFSGDCFSFLKTIIISIVELKAAQMKIVEQKIEIMGTGDAR